jgi:hypothetical protein
MRGREGRVGGMRGWGGSGRIRKCGIGGVAVVCNCIVLHCIVRVIEVY